MNAVKELVLGKGDYIIGGSTTEPFLTMDGARRLRPIVVGEVQLDASKRDALLDEMFAGMSTDPKEWARMWEYVGSDGICIRAGGLSDDDALAIILGIIEILTVPIVVDASRTVLAALAEKVTDTVLILMGEGPYPNGHIGVVDADGVLPENGPSMILIEGEFPNSSGFSTALEIRRMGLNGNEAYSFPILFDVTSVWSRGFDNERIATMIESEAALAAMLNGADIVIVKGPVAADMARLYGEDLADL